MSLIQLNHGRERGERRKQVVLLLFYMSLKSYVPSKLELESELFFALSQSGKEDLESLIVCFVGHMANCQYFNRCVKMVSRHRLTHCFVLLL